MSQKEIQKYAAITQCLQGQCTTQEAARIMGLSLRQAYRLKQKVREKGVKGMMHGNRGRTSPRRLPEELRDQILTLARGKYRGFNDTHMGEKLAAVEGLSLSRATLRTLLREARILSPCTHRPVRHRSRRERRPQEGFMLLLDGSPHDWLEGRGPSMCLVAAIDDATNRVPWAHFEEVEDAASYLRLLREVIRRQGIPLSVYTDCHSIFAVTRKSWTLEEELAGRQQSTQVARALEELGIQLILARSPQAKGRIERLFRTLQDRLLSELRLAGEKTRQEANAFLHDSFLPTYNERFAKPPLQTQKAYRSVPRGLDLDRTLSFAYSATVGNDHTVRIAHQILDIPPGPHRCSYAKAKVTVHQLLDGSWRVYHQDRLLLERPAAEANPLLRTLKRPRVGRSYRSFMDLHSQPLPSGG